MIAKVTVCFNDGHEMEIENVVLCSIPTGCTDVFQIGHKRDGIVVVDYIPLSAVRILSYEEPDDE